MEKEIYEALEQSGALKSLSWTKGIVAASVLLVAFLVAKVAGHLVRRALGKRSAGASFALSKLLSYCMVVAGFLTALGVLGLPIATLLVAPAGTDDR